MARRNSSDFYNQQRVARTPIVVNTDPASRPKPVVKRYGKTLLLLEDDQKQTFEFQGGAWVPYARSIAECRTDCDVKQLAQKVNNMTRYEVRPVLA